SWSERDQRLTRGLVTMRETRSPMRRNCRRLSADPRPALSRAGVWSPSMGKGSDPYHWLHCRGGSCLLHDPGPERKQLHSSCLTSICLPSNLHPVISASGSLRCRNPILCPNSCGHRMLGNGSAGCRTTIIDRLPARGGHAHPSKLFPMLGRQNLISSTILTSPSTLWTASRWALVFMTFGVSADPKVPIGPSRLNVTLHELFFRISDASCKILSTSCSPSATTFT